MGIDFNQAQADSPVVSASWKKSTLNWREETLLQFFKREGFDSSIDLCSATEGGEVIVQLRQELSASERGIYLLHVEERMKAELDRGLTLWCEPVGDKSKLRQLRGVQIIARD